jgi:hypothetical protein
MAANVEWEYEPLNVDFILDSADQCVVRVRAKELYNTPGTNYTLESLVSKLFYEWRKDETSPVYYIAHFELINSYEYGNSKSQRHKFHDNLKKQFASIIALSDIINKNP